MPGFGAVRRGRMRSAWTSAAGACADLGQAVRHPPVAIAAPLILPCRAFGGRPQEMDRAARIEAALAKRNYSAALCARIVRLLDGLEDRTRLKCCSSGCFVCAQELLDIVAEVEAGEQSGSSAAG